ncbi:histidine kinase [Sulfurimonas hongkongensis]|uniref:histidine kinase n=1 Tax=Sulfurimonas hongkongensis TaxID=1172190 RepID=T0JED6_9BACT|nr:ATP-binding protein [Sulfurimonas hongkongensis]EQB39375.1 histidine kinase [Sulfurimonas hongkongensis]
MKIPNLVESQETFVNAKERILLQWLSYDSPQQILEQHKIEIDFFLKEYASGVFDYFMGVIAGELEIGNCPIMQGLLSYLKDREISADELFEICSHFRRSMIEFSYDEKLDSKEMSNEISFVFDKNFRGILKYYTDTIFEKLIYARQKADKASQAKEYFLSNMSHEIRTPLNAILGFVNLLIDEDVSKIHRNYLDIILNSGENLLCIINDILDFSKLRSGEFTIEPKIFSPHDEISHTMELFVASANVKNITITSFIDPRIPKELYADALRMKQVLSNFLSNAIKFTPDGGHISVESFCKNGTLSISVSDSGIGIAKEDVQNIFLAFAQAQHCELKNSSSGTGLGLSICHQLAQHMQGSVDVESIYGVGSKFTLKIPVEAKSELCPLLEDVSEFRTLKIAVCSKESKNAYKENSFLRYADAFKMDTKKISSMDEEFDIALFVQEDVDKEFIQMAIDSEKKFIVLANEPNDDYDKYDNITSISFPLYCSKIRGAFDEVINPHSYMPHKKHSNIKFKGHILVAEDNEANQELIKILLEKYSLSFDLANNGLEALELYKKNNYDLILMDEQMPLMDGSEAVKQIASYEKKRGLKHTPVSALTANVIKGAKERGLLSGFDSFLGKPIILKELERVLKLYLKEDKLKEANMPSEFHERVVGIDAIKLKEELKLNEDELMLLLTLFIKKMKKQMPKLQVAIEERDYKQIALNAHSIKGSSGNFRIEALQKSASEMEKKAKEENSEYDYEAVFTNIKNRVKQISIV